MSEIRSRTKRDDAERFETLRKQLEVGGAIYGAYDRDRHTLSEISFMLDVAMPISIAIFDEDMRYVFINTPTYTMFDLSPNDFGIGSHLSEAHAAMTAKGLLDEKVVESAEISADLLEGRKIGDTKTRIVSLKDGRYSRLTRKTLGNGYTVSIAEDVTDLILTNNLLQDALKLGDSGYWIYDFVTKTYDVSDSLSKLFRPEQVEMVKTHGPILAIHEDDRPQFRDAISNIANTDDRFELTTRFAFLAQPLFFRSSGQLVRLPDGRPRQLQCFVQNITREYHAKRSLEKAKDEAIAASVAKSQFLANMSHEIRTPMNGVLGMAELLAGSAIDDRQREFVNVITRSATSLLTVINDILDFSKIEADALELEPHPFSMRDMVNEITTLLSPNASEKGLELIVNYPSESPHSFIGDAVRVRQVLTNLVGNALKFTDTGHVLVSVDAVPDPSGNAFLTLAVSDTGIGIEADKLSKVFDKFTQADNSTTRIYGGTGLGLSIAKRLSEMMGGDLTVDSVYGEGTTFTMSIPLPLDRSAKPVVRNTAPLKGKRALIVDDIDINRRLLSEQLGGWGMKTLAVSDGVEALLALKEAQDEKTAIQPFDIILLDYLMPGVNGRELASMIRAQPALQVPTLMLSSCDDSANSQLDNMVGIDRYLVKPVREQALFDAVLGMIYAPASEIASAPALGIAPIVEVDTQDMSVSADTAATEPQTIPKAVPQIAVMSAKDIAVERASGQIEILVAEDFPLNQDVVRLMLADTRYQPVIVENGHEAVELYRQNPGRFSAVLMDVSMPVMDGYMATRGIAEIEATTNLAHVPVIALTGHALTHEREKCMQAGMDDYLTKPVKQIELIGALDRWTGNQSRIAVA